MDVLLCQEAARTCKIAVVFQNQGKQGIYLIMGCVTNIDTEPLARNARIQGLLDTDGTSPRFSDRRQRRMKGLKETPVEHWQNHVSQLKPRQAQTLHDLPDYYHDFLSSTVTCDSFARSTKTSFVNEELVARSYSSRQGELLRPRRHGLRFQRTHRLRPGRLQVPRPRHCQSVKCTLFKVEEASNSRWKTQEVGEDFPRRILLQGHFQGLGFRVFCSLCFPRCSPTTSELEDLPVSIHLAVYVVQQDFVGSRRCVRLGDFVTLGCTTKT